MSIKKRTLHCILGAAFMVAASACQAVDLLTAYQQAVKSDPSFQAATAQRLATHEDLPQSWANLLPSLSLVAQSAANRQTSNTNVIIVSSGVTPLFASTRPIVYNTNSYNVSLTQPVINFASWFTVQQAKDTVKQADATYAAATQDLIIRVANAYFAILEAQDTLALTQAQKRAVAKQLALAHSRYEVGLDAVTPYYNAQAAFDGLTAQTIADQNNLTNSYQTLRALTGETESNAAPVAKKLPLLTPQPMNLQKWITTAENQNLSIKALRYAADAARENIKINGAGHAPTINIVGNYGRYNTGPSILEPERIDTLSTQAGLQLTVPIYQGGLVNSKVRQAQDDFQVATAELETTHRAVVTQTIQTYNSILAGIDKIRADQQAIKSKESSVTSNIAGFDAGTVTIIDVLNVQKDLYEARRTYSIDQYQYLLNTLILKQLTGTLSEVEVRQLNQWLAH